jgi:uncharacterized protein YbaA (DUF1428 family)
MSNYVDGFILPIATSKLAAYRRMAKKASSIWREHGALAYFECAGDDLAVKNMVPFPKLAGAKRSETVVFAWAVFKSRKERDRANTAIMKDPRIAKLAAGSGKLFDCSRMAYGGFKVMVQL